jgi:hypothetical protein
VTAESVRSDAGRQQAATDYGDVDMNKHPRKGGKGTTKLQDLVVVAFLDDMNQAREYETLLRLNDIPAVIKEQLDPGLDGKTAAIMVPEEYLDEAHVVIESQDAYDDLCDFTMDEDEDLDFDSDTMDDEGY